jgi:ADP-heptose:LPS heptosyltransferase
MIRTEVNNDRVHDLSGKTSITDLVDCFGRSSVLVCNDSGAMHLANAVGLPLVAIFGPTDPSVTGPVYKSPSVKVECSEGGNMNDIPPTSVLRAVTALLGL